MSARARLRDESGLSLYEVLVAILVLVVGLLGVYVSIGTSNGAVAAGEKTAVMAQAAQQQLESVEALPYGSIANNPAPTNTAGSNTKNPTYYVSACSSNTCYQWNPGVSTDKETVDVDTINGKVSPGPTTEVVADPNASTCASTSTSTCRIVLNVYTFITWTTDPDCTSCSDSYKRITVAVTNSSNGPPYQPYYLSTFVGAKGGGGSTNPLTSGSTQCLDGQETTCTH